ncbi:hypothetical protein [Rhodococcus daqingensis]|uniref:Uncharacterized protein n=1 Tax=Rhodococcus daqingensis TaxID=2479363 RepID=A0ABW2RY63_9NOCA
MSAPRDRRRGLLGGVAPLLALLVLLGALSLWAGRVASVEVSAPAGGAGIEDLAPGLPDLRHLESDAGAMELVLTPDPAEVLPARPRW